MDEINPFAEFFSHTSFALKDNRYAACSTQNKSRNNQRGNQSYFFVKISTIHLNHVFPKWLLSSVCRLFKWWTWTLTAHNWRKSRFLTCPCHTIHRVEAVALSLSNYTWKNCDFCEFVKFWENLTFVEYKNAFAHMWHI